MIDKYIELYKDGGYIREMRKYVGHAPILTCACGVIIVNDRGEILLQKRRDNGCWAIIGGAMEMGETFEETVRRETREESGLLLGKLELFQLYSGRDRIIEYPNGDVCFGPGIVFITSEYEGTIVNDPEEVLEHRFFKRSELPENLNQYDKDIILEWAGRNNMFESKYAKCEYVEKDRAVLHVWKKEAHYDDYRKPVKVYGRTCLEFKGDYSICLSLFTFVMIMIE